MCVCDCQTRGDSGSSGAALGGLWVVLRNSVGPWRALGGALGLLWWALGKPWEVHTHTDTQPFCLSVCLFVKEICVQPSDPK